MFFIPCGHLQMQIPLARDKLNMKYFPLLKQFVTATSQRFEGFLRAYSKKFNSLKYEVIVWLQPIWVADIISYFCVLTSLMTRSRLCIHVLTAPPIVWKPLINQS